MAKDKLTDYSATNASNTDVGGVNINEGMLPSDVNNAIREVMTHLKDFAEGTEAVNSLAVDNININGNTISSTDTNGNINITPNGSGAVAFTTNATFGDNDKAIFGSGSDMSLFHNGNNAFLDNDTGSLFIQTDAFSVKNATGTESVMLGTADGAVTLYHNNQSKLATTSTGVDVTGTVTADAATIDNGVLTVNDAGTRKVEISGNGFGDFTSSPVLDGGIEFTNQFGHVFSAGVSNSNNFDILDGATKIARFAGGGDISFFADDGTTQALFFDASTQNLGLGTTSPSLGSSANGLHITGASGNDGVLKLDSSDTTHSGKLQFTENGTDQWRIAYDPTNNHLEFTESGVADRMVIADGGNVGIGTSSPATGLEVATGSILCSSGGFYVNSTTVGSTAYFSYGGGNPKLWNTVNGALLFGTNNTERMRIDSGGNLLVGTTNTSPAGSNVEGINVGADGQIDASRNGSSLNLNRISTDGTIVNFRKDGTSVGSISVTGSGTTYNTTSDLRLKENIEPLVATDKLMAMNPVSYNWKADPDGPRSMGFIAQEMQEVMPEAVSAGDDEDAMMSMDYGRITPILVSALQDAHRKIEELAAEIAELKAN